MNTTTTTRHLITTEQQHLCDVCKEPATMGYCDGKSKPVYGCKAHLIKVEGI